ncbi:MAG: hypothetical protein WD491_12010 [Balneolales bacterium]
MEKVIRTIKRSQSDDEDINFWRGKTADERLDALQVLREQYIALFNKQQEDNESRKALRRVYRVIKQARS